MEKKEFPKKEFSDNVQPSTGGFSSRVFSVIKFIFGVCFLPYVYSTSISFLKEFSLLDESTQHYFWSGLISLLIIHLFIWEPVKVYTFGHKLLELIFSFFKPLVKVAPYLLPIYTLVLFIVYAILSVIFKSQGIINYFIFLFGFSMGLHLIFSAKSLRTKQSDFLKANYIFGFSLVYVLNLVLLAVSLNLIFEKFSIVNFFNNSFCIAGNIFYAIFKQLFL